MLNCMQANRDTNNVATYIVVKLFDHPYLHWRLNFALNYIGLLPNFSDTKIKMIFLEADYVKRPLFGQDIISCKVGAIPVSVKHILDCWSKIPTWHCSTATVLPCSHTTYHGVCSLPGYSLAPSGWVRQLT